MADGGEVPAPEIEPLTDGSESANDPLRVRAQARIGSILRDKWRLDSLLGVGGMASVYAATHRNGTRAAVKILHPELSVNALSRQRFLSEGHAANAVGHPGAVRILDDDTAEDGSLYLVTELLDGETLDHRRMRLGGTIPQDEVLLVADRVLDVLIAAHAQGVVHRDLKPENLFLTRSGQIKVLDFGIARLREPTTTSRLTQAGDAMGTPAYMAPEHARGLWDDVDARSDLWSVGASMFHLLSGVVVHEGRTVNEQLLEAMTRPAAPLSSVAPGASRAMCRLVDRALSFDKDARWPDAQAMREAVRAAYVESYGVSIDIAAPLVAGGSIPDRSLVRLRPGPMSDPPPAQAATIHRGTRRAESVQTALAAAGLVVALVASGLVVGSYGHMDRAEAARRASASLPAFGSAVSPPVPLPSASFGAVEATPAAPASPSEGLALPGPPEMAATDLPVAPRAPSTPSAPVSPAKPVSGASRACDPPYVIERDTGKKRWKMECL